MQKLNAAHNSTQTTFGENSHQVNIIVACMLCVQILQDGMFQVWHLSHGHRLDRN